MFLALSPLLVVFMHQPTWQTLTTTLPGNLGDPTLATWILSWEWHAMTTDPSLLFEGNIFHPFGEAIKYSDSMIPLVPIFGLVASVTGNVLAAHHVVVLSLSLFCLTTTYFLAARLTDPKCGVLAAIAFTFSGFVFMHQTHLPLLTVGFFPLAFLLLFRMLERRRLRDGALLGAASALLAMSSLYYAAIWLVSLMVVLVIDAVRSYPVSNSWLKAVGFGAGVFVCLFGPIAYVYGEFQARVNWQRDMSPNPLALADFITPAPQSLVYEPLFHWANSRSTTGLVEHGFFVGFLVMALAVVGLAVLLRRRGAADVATPRRSIYELHLLSTAGFIALLISVGPRIGPIPMPFEFLQQYVLGFDNIRAVSRLAVPFLLMITLLASLGIQGLVRRIRPSLQGVVVALICVGVLVELYVEPIHAPVAETAPIRTLLASVEEGAVVELPIRETPDSAYVYTEGPRLLASIGDWRHRWNGFSGGYPAGYIEMIPTLMLFPEAPSLELMNSLDLRYVVLHGSETGTDSTFSVNQIGGMLEKLPDASSAQRAGDAWLVDLGGG